MSNGGYKVNVRNIDLDTILVCIAVSIGVGGLKFNIIVFYSIFFNQPPKSFEFHLDFGYNEILFKIFF